MSPNFDLQDKVIVITGGSGGIGLATAVFLLEQGAKVSIADFSEKGIAAATAKIQASSYPGKLHTKLVDVRVPAEVDAWIADVVKTFGAKLDGAINLAGVIPKVINIERVEDLNDPDWQCVMDVNLNGVMHSMRAQIRVMNEFGSIINASSVCGVIGFARNAAYTATKHAVVGMTRSAAKEVGDRNIRVNAIAPGLIDTAMVAEAASRDKVDADGNKAPDAGTALRSHIKRLGKPEEVAALCAWLLCDYSRYITGTVQVIDGGYTC
jgi:NAD(P)-dependent dehydrogenase (short-subunit alcohol dehydrogenase family)